MTRDDSSAERRRPVRSYVLRQGRLTDAQERALSELWPKYGIEPVNGLLDDTVLFGRKAPLVIEIGFGNGDATWRMAQVEPDKNFIGIEVHRPGVGHLLRALEAESIDNVRVANTDAVEFLERRIADASLDGIRIWFPDPWPKKRHHKRRIVQPTFIALLARKLAPGGILHLATDWAPYAEHMLEVMDAAECFENLSPTDDYCDRPQWRPVTRFETRGEKLGHDVFDLMFARQPASSGKV